MISSREVQADEGDLTIGVGVGDDGQAESLLHHLGLGEGRGRVYSSHRRTWSGAIGYLMKGSQN